MLLPFDVIGRCRQWRHVDRCSRGRIVDHNNGQAGGLASPAPRLAFRRAALPSLSNVVVISGIEPAEPAPERAAPAVRGFGRTIYPPEVFRFLGMEFADPRTGEVDLLKTFRSLLKEVPSYGVFLEGEAFDLGTIEGYQYFEPKWRTSEPSDSRAS